MPATTIQIRRGTKAQLDTMTLAEGELGITIDNGDMGLYVGDGINNVSLVSAELLDAGVFEASTSWVFDASSTVTIRNTSAKQLRLANGSDYTDFYTDADGNLTIMPSGTSPLPGLVGIGMTPLPSAWLPGTVQIAQSNVTHSLVLTHPDANIARWDGDVIAALAILPPATPTKRNFCTGLYIATNGALTDQGRGIFLDNRGQSDAFYCRNQGPYACGIVSASERYADLTTAAYFCTTLHSQIGLLIDQQASGVSDWSLSGGIYGDNYYHLGERVRYPSDNSVYYAAKSTHIPSSSNKPVDGADWETYWTDLVWPPTWASGNNYRYPGTYVTDNFVIYQIKSTHTSSAADRPGVGENWGTYWEVYPGPAILWNSQMKPGCRSLLMINAEQGVATDSMVSITSTLDDQKALHLSLKSSDDVTAINVFGDSVSKFKVSGSGKVEIKGGNGIYFSDSNVAHGFTTYYDTDVTGFIGEVSGNGGLALKGLCDNGNIAGVTIEGLTQAANTVAAVSVTGFDRSGTGVGYIDSGSPVFSVSNAGAYATAMDGAGNWTFAGTLGKNLERISHGYFSNITCTDPFLVPSDERIKEDVRDIDYGLSCVDALHPKSFRWSKKSGYDVGKRRHGWLAQETEMALNDLGFSNKDIPCVDCDENGEYLMAHGELFPILWAAVRELHYKLKKTGVLDVSKS